MLYEPTIWGALFVSVVIWVTGNRIIAKLHEFETCVLIDTSGMHDLIRNNEEPLHERLAAIELALDGLDRVLSNIEAHTDPNFKDPFSRVE